MQQANRVVELPIDATGEIARYGLDTGRRREAQTVSLHIAGTEAASYRCEFGETDADGTIHWFAVDGDFEYTDTASVDDAWRQSESYLRIMVTSAASSGATADVAVSRGR